MSVLIILLLLLSILIIICAVIVLAAYHRYKCRPIDRLYAMLTSKSCFIHLNEIPERFVSMIVASEDHTFYQHKGIATVAVKNALRQNIKERRIVTGGSSITQQLAKNLYLKFDKTIFRKLMELVLTLKIEKTLNKNQILEMYINIIYYGCGRYGLVPAAEYYFNKKPQHLTLNQMFMLIRVLSAPTAMNPLIHTDVYARLRNKLVKSLKKKQALSEEEGRIICSYNADKLDPELRVPTNEAEKYVEIPMKNEQYGPLSGFGE